MKKLNVFEFSLNILKRAIRVVSIINCSPFSKFLMMNWENSSIKLSLFIEDGRMLLKIRTTNRYSFKSGIRPKVKQESKYSQIHSKI